MPVGKLGPGAGQGANYSQGSVNIEHGKSSQQIASEGKNIQSTGIAKADKGADYSAGSVSIDHATHSQATATAGNQASLAIGKGGQGGK